MCGKHKGGRGKGITISGPSNQALKSEKAAFIFHRFELPNPDWKNFKSIKNFPSYAEKNGRFTS